MRNYLLGLPTLASQVNNRAEDLLTIFYLPPRWFVIQYIPLWSCLLNDDREELYSAASIFESFIYFRLMMIKL